PVVVAIVDSTNRVAAKTVETRSTNAPVAALISPAVAPEQANLAAVSIVAAKISDSAKDATEGRGALFWGSMGAGVMFIFMLAVIIFLRRGRQDPSLISEAFARERLSVH